MAKVPSLSMRQLRGAVPEKEVWYPILWKKSLGTVENHHSLLRRTEHDAPRCILMVDSCSPFCGWVPVRSSWLLLLQIRPRFWFLRVQSQSTDMVHRTKVGEEIVGCRTDPPRIVDANRLCKRADCRKVVVSFRNIGHCYRPPPGNRGHQFLSTNCDSCQSVTFCEIRSMLLEKFPFPILPKTEGEDVVVNIAAKAILSAQCDEMTYPVSSQTLCPANF